MTKDLDSLRERAGLISVLSSARAGRNRVISHWSLEAVSKPCTMAFQGALEGHRTARHRF
jgi:hypothetical protein